MGISPVFSHRSRDDVRMKRSVDAVTLRNKCFLISEKTCESANVHPKLRFSIKTYGNIICQWGKLTNDIFKVTLWWCVT